MRLNQPVEVLFVAPLPERAAQAIHCLRVNYRGHVQRPLVRDNVAGESCVLCLCASVLCAGYMGVCLLYTSPSPRDKRQSRMPSSA